MNAPTARSSPIFLRENRPRRPCGHHTNPDSPAVQAALVSSPGAHVASAGSAYDRDASKPASEGVPLSPAGPADPVRQGHGGARMTDTPKPLVMTCGDPSGIGPEIAPRARAALGAGVPFAWIGDPAHLPAGTAWTEIAAPEEAADVAADHLPVLRLGFPAPAVPGEPNPANAAGVVAAIDRAVVLARQGAAGGIVTAPINKAALRAGAGFAFPGHTEYLAHLAGGAHVVMMLACPALRVVPVTIHIPLAQVPSRLTPALLEETLRLTHAGLKSDFGIAHPRIAVAGLNPHAGESATMGNEERDLIAPVLERLRADGLALSGPHAADSMFHEAARANYDAAVCMYHDQALIPIKTVDFAGGVNVTLGLPFVRSSPDHGTAYDIAGTGRADPASTIAALELAQTMAARRARSAGAAA